MKKKICHVDLWGNSMGTISSKTEIEQMINFLYYLKRWKQGAGPKPRPIKSDRNNIRFFPEEVE